RPGHAPEFSGTYRNYPHTIQEHRLFTWCKGTTGVPQIPRYRHHEISISHNRRVFPFGQALVHKKSKTLIKCTTKQHWYGAVFSIHGRCPDEPNRQGMRTTKDFTLGLDQRSLFRPNCGYQCSIRNRYRWCTFSRYTDSPVRQPGISPRPPQYWRLRRDLPQFPDRCPG